MVAAVCFSLAALANFINGTRVTLFGYGVVEQARPPSADPPVDWAAVRRRQRVTGPLQLAASVLFGGLAVVIWLRLD